MTTPIRLADSGSLIIVSSTLCFKVRLHSQRISRAKLCMLDDLGMLLRWIFRSDDPLLLLATDCDQSPQHSLHSCFLPFNRQVMASVAAPRPPLTFETSIGFLGFLLWLLYLLPPLLALWRDRLPKVRIFPFYHIEDESLREAVTPMIFDCDCTITCATLYCLYCTHINEPYDSFPLPPTRHLYNYCWTACQISHSAELASWQSHDVIPRWSLGLC
jgi:hypothetical protein